jgi:large subunit ribosomal protein L29
MSKAKDYRDQTVDELGAVLLDERKKLFQLRNKSAQEKKLEKPHEIVETRRNIARLLTVLTEKSSNKTR